MSATASSSSTSSSSWKRCCRKLALLPLFAALLAVGMQPCRAQSNNPQAIPPSFAVQPLYACKMEVKDLPQFEGMPSPEMTAGQLGLYASTLGMLDQWKIFNNGDPTDATNSNIGNTVDDSQNGGDSSISGGTMEARLQAKLQKVGGAVKRRAPGSVPDSARVAAPAPATGAETQLPAAPPAERYIVSRPAAGPNAGRSTFTYSAAPTAAAAASGHHKQQQQPQLQPQQVYQLAAVRHAASLLNATTLGLGPTAAAEAAAAAASLGAASAAHRLPWRQQYEARLLAAARNSSAVYADAAATAASSTAAVIQAAAAAAGLPVQQQQQPAHQQQQQQQQQQHEELQEGPVLSNLPPSTSPVRRLFAAANKGTDGRHVCNKGTPTNSTQAPFGRSSFSSKVGSILGITMADSGVIPADAAIAVGPNHVVHVVNSMVKILPVGTNGELPKSLKPGQMRLIPLPDWFGLVAAPCDGGYITPSATYDKEVGRFLVAATCGGDSNQVLLSVSANSSAVGSWILYSFAGEATQGTRMQCINESYPISFHSQVGYNKDGVFLTFVHNCPSNQETATGAIIYALPKWAVYKGATYFWCPAWTAWDIYDAVGQKNNDDLYPGAFVQMQPVIPQRAADVQGEVTYFVGDNLSWVAPLKRNILTVAALINTGSLWLYEGPSSNAPAPLLVARVINRGMNAEIQTPDVKLKQPQSDLAAGIQQCQPLDGGAMRPPGVWDGGAVLYANKIYIVDRGPDLAVPFRPDMFMPTLYWAILSPSFCVGGPCGPWFGTDWGWSDGWDWRTGMWATKSDRGRNPFKDPSYYNQVFLFPSTSQPPPASLVQGRRRLQQAPPERGPAPDGSWSGPIRGAGVRISSRRQMLAAVRAAKVHARRVRKLLRAAAIADGMWPGRVVLQGNTAQASSAAASSSTASAATPSKGTAAAMEVLLGPALAHSPQAYGLGTLSSSLVGSGNATVAATAVSAASHQAQPWVGVASSLPHTHGNSSAGVGGAAPPLGLNTVSPAVPANISAADAFHNRTVSAAFFALWGSGGSGGMPQNTLWQGWGYNYFYYDYYQWWREHYFMRNLYMNLRIPPKTNPCKYYKDWVIDNEVTFGAINSKHGVIEFVSQGDNPVGLAAPSVAVRGGSMLIAFSYSGPYNVPMTNGGIKAYPGVGYSIIDVNAPSSSGGAFNLAQAGAGCINQGGNTRWGSYSGADIHFPSYKIWTAVEYAYQASDWTGISNAATQINVFS